MVAEPIDVRAEFDVFFESAYPWLASQLRAITGDAETARWAVDTAFARCWQSWASVRKLPDPLNWVRWTAIRATATGPRREFPLRRRAPEPSAIAADSEEAVVLDALHRLPQSQRRAIVLHYMGDVTVAELALRSGTTPDAVEWLLDTGFDALVGLLTWPDEPGAEDAGGDLRYDWTAEALGDTATRLAADVTVPAPASVLQRAAVLRWARRAVPIAVSAACVSGVVLLAAQLNPADSTVARTPYSYTEAARAPYDEAPVAGTVPVVGTSPVADVREVPLGTSIVSVARSTPLQDFGISSPAAPAAPGAVPDGGSVARTGFSTGSAGSAGVTGGGATGGGTTGGGTTGGGTTGTAPQTGGGTTPPPGGSGTAPPTAVPPTTVPPTTVPPTTVPPTTVPPTTTPPTTAPPTTAPSTTTTPPPTTTSVAPTTTDAPVTTTTVTTTTVAETTVAETATTRATTTKATPAPDPASPTETTTTTTRTTPPTTTPPTTTPAVDPTTANETGS